MTTAWMMILTTWSTAHKFPLSKMSAQFMSEGFHLLIFRDDVELYTWLSINLKDVIIVDDWYLSLVGAWCIDQSFM